MSGEVKNIVSCDKCGRNIRIKFKHKCVGELEYKYFCCRRCNAVYVVSVTDEALRKEVERYQKIMEDAQKKTVPPEMLQEARLILQNNVQRSRELKAKYPLKSSSREIGF